MAFSRKVPLRWPRSPAFWGLQSSRAHWRQLRLSPFCHFQGSHFSSDPVSHCKDCILHLAIIKLLTCLSPASLSFLPASGETARAVSRWAVVRTPEQECSRSLPPPLRIFHRPRRWPLLWWRPHVDPPSASPNYSCEIRWQYITLLVDRDISEKACTLSLGCLHTEQLGRPAFSASPRGSYDSGRPTYFECQKPES